MGRATVRAQIASYFAPANVAGLSTTYRSGPKEIPAQAFDLSANGGSGAVLVIHMARDKETALTMGPENAAQKFDVHDIAMELLFQSVKVDPMVAMDDHDALIDALMVHFRADRTLGSTNGVPIWQAGRDTEGIDIELAEPKLGKQNTIVNGVIRFKAFEIVTG